MDNLLKVAMAELGVKELSGPLHNKRILEYAQQAGFSWVNDDETPWCSIFLSWCAMKAGLKRSKQASARSWLNIGSKETDPEPGDVVVFWREKPESWKGHIGIFTGYSKDGTRIYCLGGNQGNQVSVTAMPASQLLGFRRLGASATVKLPSKTLKKGDTGEEVKLLQNALKLKGYNPGTSDGIYGSKTEAAVKQLQATNSSLTINGNFDKKTRDYLQSLLNE